MIARRYRLDLGRWSAGYTESAILSGDFSPWYLNPYPLIPLEVTQLVLEYLHSTRAGSCNMVMAVDLRYNGEHLDAYSSVYVDDIPPTSAWNIPYRIGGQAGVQWADPFGWDGMELWLDYTAISRYTYSYRPGKSEGDYVDGNLLLGHPLGPDADLITARPSPHPRPVAGRRVRDEPG